MHCSKWMNYDYIVFYTKAHSALLRACAYKYGIRSFSSNSIFSDLSNKTFIKNACFLTLIKDTPYFLFPKINFMENVSPFTKMLNCIIRKFLDKLLHQMFFKIQAFNLWTCAILYLL